mgnify:CR=1 FL=1
MRAGKQLAVKNVTKTLKAENQMLQMQKMNNNCSMVMKLVNLELIFTV